MSLIHRAVSQLARALDVLKVPYAIMGGSACFLLGSPRATTNIDLVVDVSCLKDMSVEILAVKLKGLAGFTTPAVALSDAVVPLEIFDPEAWSRRPQYRQVTTHRISKQLPDEYEVYIFSPAWLLREKILAIQQRGHPGTPKFVTDLLDIQFLVCLIEENEYGKDLFDVGRRDYAESIKEFLARGDVNSATREAVTKIFIIHH